MKRLILIVLAFMVGISPIDAKRKANRPKADTYTAEECIDAFVGRMNANAKQFGMTNTCFKNASGWGAEGHVSTASDMVRLLMAATTYDKLMLYWGWETYEINVMGANPRTIKVKNTYKGPKAASLGEHYVIFGGKSGSWSRGRGKGHWRNLASAVKSNIDDRWLIGCVMDTGKDRFVAMKQLMDWLEAKRVNPDTPDSLALDCNYAAATVLPLHSGMAYRDFNPVMVGKDADTQMAPYSMTKMMTAIIALDYCLPDEIITVQESDIMKGSGPKLYDGDKLTMEEAIIALMLPSSNTLAKAISRHVGEKILTLHNEGPKVKKSKKARK